MTRVPHDDGADAGTERPAEARRVVSAHQDVEESLSDMVGLRPEKLADFVGQTALKARLSVYVRAAKKRDEPLDHVLFHGPPGLGKTTLARILAAEMGVKIHETSGPAIEHKGVLAGHLTALGPGDLLFIDEIHRMTPIVEESLYGAMEDGRIDLPVGEGSRARTMPFKLAPFTLVGATTRTALLTAPLRERFQIVEQIQFYSDDELAAIVTRSAGLLGFPATATGAREIGRRSRGTPRIANKLVRRVRDFTQDRGRKTIDEADADYGLTQLGIDGAGLDNADRRILRCIVKVFDGGPVGIDAIAATLSMPRDTLEDVYEPFLLQRGLLTRTARGRQTTRTALEDLGPADGGGRGQGELF